MVTQESQQHQQVVVYLLRRQQQDDGKETKQKSRREDPGQEYARQCAERRGAFQDDGEADVRKTSPEKWRGAAARAGNDRHNARADGHADVWLAVALLVTSAVP